MNSFRQTWQIIERGLCILASFVEHVVLVSVNRPLGHVARWTLSTALLLYLVHKAKHLLLLCEKLLHHCLLLHNKVSHFVGRHSHSSVVCVVCLVEITIQLVRFLVVKVKWPFICLLVHMWIDAFHSVRVTIINVSCRVNFIRPILRLLFPEIVLVIGRGKRSIRGVWRILIFFTLS